MSCVEKLSKIFLIIELLLVGDKLRPTSPIWGKKVPPSTENCGVGGRRSPYAKQRIRMDLDMFILVHHGLITYPNSITVTLSLQLLVHLVLVSMLGGMPSTLVSDILPAMLHCALPAQTWATLRHDNIYDAFIPMLLV